MYIVINYNIVIMSRDNIILLRRALVHITVNILARGPLFK